MSLQGQRTTTSAIDWDDFRSLIGKLERDGEYKFCVLIATGVFTGLRISDLLNLRFNQFNGEVLEVNERKTGKHRRIKINHDLKSVIMRLKEKMKVKEDSLMFLNRYSTKPIDQSYVNVKLKEIFKKYNIKVEGNCSSHLFRKTLGNRVMKMNNGKNEALYLLMDMFSHSNPSTTKRYLGIREKELFSVYDSLNL
ncbi:integrase [Candidatus Woesearchaeota archaeon]|nr:integrase [Candidatus Woesearchaeota archaeon]